MPLPDRTTYNFANEEWLSIVQGEKCGKLENTLLAILLEFERLRLRKDKEAYLAVASSLFLHG